MYTCVEIAVYLEYLVYQQTTKWLKLYYIRKSKVNYFIVKHKF